MEINEFMQSKWVKAAQDPDARARVMDEMPDWIKNVTNSELADKARRLKDFLTSDRCSTGDIVLVVAALLYLISPIDAIPDFIPFVGWLDDVALAGLVLGYLDRKASVIDAQVVDVS